MIIKEIVKKKIKEIQNRGKLPILVGGTGLYMKAVLYDYQLEEETKKQYNMETEQLYERVLEVDPNTTIHKNNRKRLERALSFYETYGYPISEKKKDSQLKYDTCIIGLTTSREILYDRINKRVDNMIKNGLMAEARDIYHSNIRTKAVLTPIGYKELFPYFKEEKSLEECLDEMKKNSRHYAKRQYTWFLNQMDVVWFDVCFNDFSKTIQEVLDYLEKKKKMSVKNN